MSNNNNVRIHSVHTRDYVKNGNSFDSEEAVAYWFLGFVVLLILGGLIIVVTTPAMNEMTNETNKMIDAGMMSEQTANSYEWCIGWFGAIALILIVGLFIGAILQGQEARR